MAATCPALEATNLARGYGDRWAVSGINLRLATGRSLLLAGPNGSGKTTLLRLLATTLQPNEGRLQVLGKNPTDDAMAARRPIALLTHRTQLYNELTALENLEVSARLLGLKPDKQRSTALLERVGLSGRGQHRARTFSAGMRKRLAFARILLQDPQIVLLDEPYGQLDPSGFGFVDKLVEELRRQGKTLVLSTHLLDRAAPTLDSGLILKGGRMAWVGPARDLPAAYAHETHP
ncbi:MAG: heme ABC exporter ATP-binding protein CcmA [Rickettsiales bacterium]|nr:heme ABC exporter ATP-binding protein CcmA [Rickettsiales bacterium]